MAVPVVPKFSNIVRATPVALGPSSGTVAALALGDVANDISANIAGNRQAKDAALGFADAMEEKDPVTARMYRSIANAIPIYDPNAGTGGTGGTRAGGGGSGGFFGGSGIGKGLMQDMLDQLQVQRRQNAELELENVKTKNDAALIGLRSAAEVGVIRAQSEKARELENLRTANDREIEAIKAKISEEKDARRRADLQLELNEKGEYRKTLDRQMQHHEDEAEIQRQRIKLQAIKSAAELSSPTAGPGTTNNQLMDFIASDPALLARLNKFGTDMATNAHKKTEVARIKAERDNWLNTIRGRMKAKPNASALGNAMLNAVGIDIPDLPPMSEGGSVDPTSALLLPTSVDEALKGFLESGSSLLNQPTDE